MDLPANWPPPWELDDEPYSIVWLLRLAAWRAETARADKQSNGNK